MAMAMDSFDRYENMEFELNGSIGETWKEVQKIINQEDNLKQLSILLNHDIVNDVRIYPPPELVFSWTRYCSPDSVKVVILGQDPYPGPNEAHGLSFSVPDGVPIPPSLATIYAELKNDIPGFKHPGHGSLIGWAKQGVLLLNTYLTVRKGKSNCCQDKDSHDQAQRDCWKKFTNALLSHLSRTNKKLVFMLWGKEAQESRASIEMNKGHLILEHCHPSPKASLKGGGFLGCKHFSKCNEFLRNQQDQENYKTHIDWNWLPTPENTLPEYLFPRILLPQDIPSDKQNSQDPNRLPENVCPHPYDRVFSEGNNNPVYWDWLPLYLPLSFPECPTVLHWLPVDWSWLDIDLSLLPKTTGVPNKCIIESSDPLFPLWQRNN